MANGNASNGKMVKGVGKLDDNSTADEDPPRETWNSRTEFLLSCIGLSVGIGNVWRFPYLAYQNGGGAFLLPYTIILLLVGKPMYFLELALGQYSGMGPMKVWKCSPVSMGVGAAMIIMSLIVAVYYTVIISYTIFFMAASLAAEVPWANCNEWWGADERCFERSRNNSFFNLTNATVSTTTSANLTACDRGFQTPSEQYWKKYVLHIDESTGIGDLGEVRWELACCLLFTWVLVFLCLFKGIKSSGKVVYFTATFPYAILLILFIRGVTLEGASKGIIYFFLPQWDKLLLINTWANAAQQVFYSLGISWGSLIMFGSYTQFRNRVHVDAFIVSSLDFMTSIIAGVVIFSVLGALATEMDRDISDVVRSGQGLAFVAYPEALARLPVPQLWSVLFFFMLFTLGLDSEFATLETILTVIYDEFPKTRNHKPIICFVACTICFFLGLPCVTNGGQYVFDIMDTYGGGFTVLVIGAFEMIGIMWIYGVSRVCDNFEYMLGFRPNIFWRVCWTVISPCALLFIFIFYCVDFTPPKYECYEYPAWGHGIGWTLLLISVVQIPIFAIGTMIYYWKKGDIRAAFRPHPTWGPNDAAERKAAALDEAMTQPPPYVMYPNSLTNRSNGSNGQNGTNGTYVYSISSAL